MTEKKPTFDELGLSKQLLKQLEKLNFIHPTPIQHKAIPAALKGDDVIGIAQTGTGKTLAFSLPMIQRIADGKHIALVLLPTRELAVQVEKEVFKLGRYFGLKTALLIGGASANVQIKNLRRKPSVIIATPGRLIDLLEQGHVDLRRLNTLVMDEADRMLDMGFEPQIRKVLAAVPKERQTFLFSATMPDKISNIAKKYMEQPLRVEIAPAGTTAERVEQEAFVIDRRDKLALLEKLLSETKGATLVFSRTKHGAKNLARKLRDRGYTAAEIHGNRSQKQRQVALEGFRKGRFRVLVATDIASRGIDVKDIKFVINYDIPDQLEDYVHRIGRTGRAGRAGKAITFFTPQQKRELRDLERLIKNRIPFSKTPEISQSEEDRARAMQGEREPRQRRRPSGRGRYGRRASGGGRPRRSGGGGRSQRSAQGGRPRRSGRRRSQTK